MTKKMKTETLNDTPTIALAQTPSEPIQPSATAGEPVEIDDNWVRAMEKPSVIPMLDIWNFAILPSDVQVSYIASLDVITLRQWAAEVERQLHDFETGLIAPPEGFDAMYSQAPAGTSNGHLTLS